MFLSNHVCVFFRKINTIKAVVTMFWLVWNNDLTTKHTNQMIKWEVHGVMLPGAMSLKYAFWRYLRRFGSAEKKWKQCLSTIHCGGIWDDLEVQRKKWKQCLSIMHCNGISNDLVLQRNNENNVSQPCTAAVQGLQVATPIRMINSTREAILQHITCDGVSA